LPFPFELFLVRDMCPRADCHIPFLSPPTLFFPTASLLSLSRPLLSPRLLVFGCDFCCRPFEIGSFFFDQGVYCFGKSERSSSLPVSLFFGLFFWFYTTPPGPIIHSSDFSGCLPLSMAPFSFRSRTIRCISLLPRERSARLPLSDDRMSPLLLFAIS